MLQIWKCSEGCGSIALVKIVNPIDHDIQVTIPDINKLKHMYYGYQMPRYGDP